MVAALATLETGTPLAKTRAEVDKNDDCHDDDCDHDDCHDDDCGDNDENDDKAFGSEKVELAVNTLRYFASGHQRVMLDIFSPQYDGSLYFFLDRSSNSLKLFGSR